MVRGGKRRRTYRNVWTFTVGVAAAIVMAAGFALASHEALQHGWGISASWAAIGCVFIWFISCAAVFPCVRLRPDALVVDNFVVRYVIPWGSVKEIDVTDGFEVVVRGWDEPVWALALSASLIGLVTGYRTNNRVARGIAEYRRQHADPSSGGQVRRRLHAHPVSFVAWWVFLGVVIPLLKLYG